MSNQRREVKKAVAQALREGRILKMYKTKALPIGRRSVTVGKYKTATQAAGAGYLLTIGQQDWIISNEWDAAGKFIDYVGRNDAWDALHGRGKERNPQ